MMGMIVERYSNFTVALIDLSEYEHIDYDEVVANWCHSQGYEPKMTSSFKLDMCPITPYSEILKGCGK